MSGAPSEGLLLSAAEDGVADFLKVSGDSVMMFL